MPRLIIAVVLLVVAHGLGDARAAAQEPAAAPRNRRHAMPESATVRVVRITDLDRITVRIRKDEFDVALARVLPFSEWPATAAPQVATELRQRAIELLRSRLVGKDGVYFTLYKETPGANEAPLVLLSRLAPADWDAQMPAGRTGWGIVNYNLWVIESGYSPDVTTAAALDRAVPRIPESLFGEAQGYAKKSKAGIFRAESVAADVEGAARKRSDPPPLALPDLDSETLLQTTRVLLDSSQSRVCVAACRAIDDILPRLDDSTRLRVVRQQLQQTSKSGRHDSNMRPLRPERSALARLSYAPMCAMHGFALRVGRRNYGRFRRARQGRR